MRDESHSLLHGTPCGRDQAPQERVRVPVNILRLGCLNVDTMTGEKLHAVNFNFKHSGTEVQKLDILAMVEVGPGQLDALNEQGWLCSDSHLASRHEGVAFHLSERVRFLKWEKFEIGPRALGVTLTVPGHQYSFIACYAPTEGYSSAEYQEFLSSLAPFFVFNHRHTTIFMGAQINTTTKKPVKTKQEVADLFGNFFLLTL